MDPKDISKAKSPDIRGSLAAMHRAAQMARQTAIDTNTGIIVFRDGKVVRVSAAELRRERDEAMTITHTIPAGTSVLDDLGLNRAYIVKAKLALRVQMTVSELGLNQRDAAQHMGISPPRLSQLTKGRLDGVSQSKLEECLVALGHDVITYIGPRREGTGTR